MNHAAKCLACILITASATAQSPLPKQGYVPDAKTAVRIAEAVLSPIYGEDKIKSERPFHATLNHGVWTIEGTLPPQYEDGGVAEIRINKQTGAIISYIHGK